MIGKTHLDYVAIDKCFTPLPMYGHLSNKTAEYIAAEPAFQVANDAVLSLPDWPSFRELAGNADAAIPPGGPDRTRDVVTELMHFGARDGDELELKVYKSPNVAANATLMYRMHGGGMISLCVSI